MGGDSVPFLDDGWDSGLVEGGAYDGAYEGGDLSLSESDLGLDPIEGGTAKPVWEAHEELESLIVEIDEGLTSPEVYQSYINDYIIDLPAHTKKQRNKKHAKGARGGGLDDADGDIDGPVEFFSAMSSMLGSIIL